MKGLCPVAGGLSRCDIISRKQCQVRKQGRAGPSLGHRRGPQKVEEMVDAMERLETYAYCFGDRGDGTL